MLVMRMLGLTDSFVQCSIAVPHAVGDELMLGVLQPKKQHNHCPYMQRAWS